MARETISVDMTPTRAPSGQSLPSSRPTSSTSRPGSSSLRSASRNASSLRSSSPTKVTGRPPSSRLSTRASRQNSGRLRRQVSQMSSISFYDRAKLILGRPSDDRHPDELNVLEGWFRKKSKLFEKLSRIRSSGRFRRRIQRGLRGRLPTTIISSSFIPIPNRLLSVTMLSRRLSITFSWIPS